MKRVFVSIAAVAGVLGLAASASAADLPRRYNPVVPKAEPLYAPFYNWTGFYLGINGGGAWGTSEWDSTDEFDLTGALIGGTIGYNWQAGSVVFGLEGDLDWTNISGDTQRFCGVGCETSNSWLSTVRGRLGYAFDRILPYVTGGLAMGNIEASVPFFPGESDTGFGWTAGAGLEVALTNNWTAKAEYLYVDLGDIDCGFNCGGGFPTDKVTFTTHIVRGGINYRF
jgi:outer membrane immunogenic protein